MFLTKPLLFVAFILFLSKLPLIVRYLTRQPPDHSDFVVIDKFGDIPLQNRLIQILKDISPIETTVEEQRAKYWHFGEVEDINIDGTCNNSYLIPNKNHTNCHLPTNFDLGRYQFLYGGYHSLKDSVNTMLSRVNVFEKYIFNGDTHVQSSSSNYKEYQKEIFENVFTEQLQDAAYKICTDKYPILDPYGLKFAIQLPQQLSMLHHDATQFYGASRFLYPLYLLAIMDKSNLYNEYKIKEIQAIIYIHRWQWKQGDGGEFILYDKGVEYEPTIVKPLSRSLILVDGTKYMHGTTMLKPYLPLTPLNRNTIYDLRFNNTIYDNKWHLFQINSENKSIDTNISFTDDMLRMALIVRARCFESEQQKKDYDPFIEGNKISTHTIRDNLIADLIVNRNYNKNMLVNMTPLDFIIKLMDTYIEMPWIEAYLPFNYCAISLLDGFEWIKYLLEYICN